MRGGLSEILAVTVLSFNLILPPPPRVNTTKIGIVKLDLCHLLSMITGLYIWGMNITRSSRESYWGC